ncbi:DUF6812 domain-containing protein [Oceanithermus desulfurans]|uniref:Uncharacterized protein n=1 Tax=Oceanithermus profundus TaxID=187137 RepID=A0A7C5SPG0_9DEIN|nr:hypothetical protein [Oceanithermus profundus]
MYARSTEPFEVRVHTTEFRIYGSMHLPKGGGTATFLNKDKRPLVPLTGVLVYAPGYDHPPRAEEMRAAADFLAVQKREILWVVGGRPDRAELPGVPVKKQRMALLFGCCVLVGVLVTPAGVRLSDFLASAKPFQTLFDVRLYALAGDTPARELEVRQVFEFVTVNVQRILGIMEAPRFDDEDTRLTLFR